METKQTGVDTGGFESRLLVLEKRVAALEKLASIKRKRVVRRTKIYTAEEKAAIRARLVAGREAARKKRELEAKANKKGGNLYSKAVKPAEASK